MKRQQRLRDVYGVYLLLWLMITSRKPIGSNMFSKEWDLLVVLDACRVDALREIQDEYAFLTDIGETWSLGSTSKEWIEQTFIEEYADEISQTAYITGNPFSNTLLGDRKRTEYGATTLNSWLERATWPEKLLQSNLVESTSCAHIEPLWGEGPHGEFQQSSSPSSITNHTIKAARSGDFDRVIAHYMQPHSPYYASSKKYDELSELEKSPFEALRNGASKDKVWQAYLDNLRYVLDHVETLLENVDGTVLITADHGELFGEWGMYYHHAGHPHPNLKKVPLVKTEERDKETVVPDVTLGDGDENYEVSDKQLKALGYL
jgi:hypothetical protein